MNNATLTWDSWQPDDPELAEGFRLWRDGQLAAAEARFRERMESGADDAARGLGSVLWTAGRFREAKSAFSDALRQSPWNPMHWSNLGLVQRDLGQFQAALLAFDMALALAPEYEPAWNEKANVLYDLGQYHAALPLYRHALSLNNQRAVVHHNLGMCLQAMGRTSEALKSFRQALGLDPGYQYSLTMVAKLTSL